VYVIIGEIEKISGKTDRYLRTSVSSIQYLYAVKGYFYTSRCEGREYFLPSIVQLEACTVVHSLIN